ncbi:MAG TPA: lipopolysaccharide assembly protein LapA domain-containing protein [Magnetospirillaceae bacterium]|jgi:uncharacterized integral membrane protein
MRFIAWLVGVPVAILFVLFAVSNRDSVTIGIWPFTDGISAPSFVVALVPFVLGLLLGVGYGSVGTMRARWRHRRAASKVDKLEQQMAEMRTHSRSSGRSSQAIAGPASTPASTIDAPPLP